MDRGNRVGGGRRELAEHHNRGRRRGEVLSAQWAMLFAIIAGLRHSACARHSAFQGNRNHLLDLDAQDCEHTLEIVIVEKMYVKDTAPLAVAQFDLGAHPLAQLGLKLIDVRVGGELPRFA